MRRFFLFLVVFTSILLADKGLTLSGSIKDKKTQKSLPNVNISVLGTDMGTVSDPNGNFSIDLDDGSYQLQFSLIGFKSTIKRFDLGDGHLVTSINMVSNLLGKVSQEVSGTIRNGKTGKPLKSANVYIEKEGIGTATDDYGYYSLTDLPMGKYLIEISHIGFTTYYEIINIPRAESFDIQLYPALILMDNLVVTGTRTERYLKDTPVTTHVIKGEKLTERGAVDLSQLIQESTGINVVENQFGTGVELNGFDANHILLLVDGAKVVGRVNGQLDMSQIPINQIERIEIVKGSTSALYGSEAMGGVINVFTKMPINPTTLNSEITLGSFGQQNQSLSFSRSNKKANWTMNGGHRSYGGYDLDDETIWEDGSRYDKRNLGFKYNRTVSDRLNILFDTRYFVETQTLISSHVFKDLSNNNRASIRAKFEYNLENWVLKSSLEQSEYNHGFDRIVIKSGNLIKGSLTTDNLFSSNFQFIREGKSHNILGGLGLDRESITSDRVQDGFRDSDLVNYFFQDEIDISNKWVMVAGLRMDHHSIYGKHTSPKISIMFKPEMISRIRIAYGEGFRAPSFKELFLDYSNISVGYHIIGNSDLNPESSKNINLDIERWNTGKYHGRINLFWNEISGLIDYKYLGMVQGQSTYQSINLSSVSTRGIEVDLTYFITDKFETWVGYSLLDTWDKDNKRMLPLKARHKNQFGFRYSYSNGLKLNLRMQSMGERFNWEENEERETIQKVIDSYTTINTHISFPLPLGLSGFAGGKNLTNYVDKVWGPMPGREWYGGIRFDLTKKQKRK
ncbi:MAG: TonB-dependent receptor [Candidatus Marinimicrobia bacterium]|nr:TonB-dependent receptor [Candidatus Neomarinimicrobiota bacterium]MBL7010683.1 TonB-dependent receptor [Candidatus Neomarinimicrobiota bacterium]MBL7031140.1 TonB-dependent receptor [Candidatus Neomarinimicrobiota bacterium]